MMDWMVILSHSTMYSKFCQLMINTAFLQIIILQYMITWYRITLHIDLTLLRLSDCLTVSSQYFLTNKHFIIAGKLGLTTKLGEILSESLSNKRNCVSQCESPHSFANPQLSTANQSILQSSRLRLNLFEVGVNWP